MTPEFITFTGIDDRTDLTRADELARAYPIEWGVLFSPGNQDARYPSRQGVSEILSINGSKSAHLCGGYSKHVIGEGNVPRQIPISHFSRMQLNMDMSFPKYHLHEVQELYNIKIILQHRDEEFTHTQFLQLFDRSAGTGVTPETIPERPSVPDRMVGYAGGMGPDTVLDYLRGIRGGSCPFWIDMESRVRTDGWFDLDKVERVCELVFA